MPESDPQKSYSIWNRPWRGPTRIAAWLALLAGIVFILVACLAMVTWTNLQPLQLATSSLLIALGVTLSFGALILAIRWIRRPGNFRVSLFILACLLTLVVLFYAVENWRGKRAWENHRRQWAAKGEQFSFLALVPPPVPDDKNLAMSSLLSPPLNLMRGTQGLVWLDTNGMARLEKISASARLKYQTNDVILGNQEKGTFADLEATARFYRGNTNYPQAQSGASAAETILAALSEFEGDLKELHDASANRPQARFPIDYKFEPYSAILLPHLSHVKNLAQVLQVRATAELAANRAAEAFEDLKLSFRLSDSIREEPILIDHLVRISMLTMSLQTIREGLARHSWSETQLKELQSYLDALDILAEYKRCMRGERAAMVSELNYLKRHRAAIRNLDYPLGQEPTFSPAFLWIPSGWFFQNMLTISQMHQNFFLAAVDERAHRVFPQVSNDGMRAFNSLRAGPYTLMAKLLFPALDKTVQKSAQAQVFVDAARVACALERYRLANGTFPEALEKLKAGFLDKIPTDVIDGQPLRYTRDAGTSYVLYSIGWNQTDDAGSPGLILKNAESFADLTKGDWVWQMPAKL